MGEDGEWCWKQMEIYKLPTKVKWGVGGAGVGMVHSRGLEGLQKAGG
jgi:hypothetical protein